MESITLSGGRDLYFYTRQGTFAFRPSKALFYYFSKNFSISRNEKKLGFLICFVYTSMIIKLLSIFDPYYVWHPYS